MNKTIIPVPKGIKYLTEWDGFTLPDHPCIINKQLTGCGFTEYVIRSPFNSILISPRKILLENKVDQHNPKYLSSIGELREVEDMRVIYYAKSDESDLCVDKDLQNIKSSKGTPEIEDNTNIITYKQNLREAINNFIQRRKPIKICVTYDSFRKVKEVLKELGLLDKFYFVVDESQAVFTDSRYKASTELEFVTELQGLQKVAYVSATPMIEDYLDLVDEFKNLPYYSFDWEVNDVGRIVRPDIVARPCRSINEVAKKIISEFRDGNYQKKTLIDDKGNPVQVVESKEIIIYVNSIKNICDIIRQNKLTVDETNIICSKSQGNSKKIRTAFKTVYNELGRSGREVPKEDKIIGSVPIPDKTTGIVINKPITLCTKTVYLGADFYSDCARSIVLSDANIECLAVDITLDLPQILGRQRCDKNPWKNSLEVWFKEGVGVGDLTRDEFEDFIKEKIRKTDNLLSAYETAKQDAKNDLADKYLKAVKVENYRDDYVAVNRHAGSNIIPQFNNLVMVSERRAFDIQQVDYKDRFAVFNRIGEVFGLTNELMSAELNIITTTINSFKRFPEKMKYCCDLIINKGQEWCNYLPEPYRTYIQTLGIDFIVTSSYRKYNLDEAMIKRGIGRVFSQDDLEEIITGYFKVGQRYSKAQIKQDLQEIYSRLGIPGKVKSTDLEKWFEIRPAKLQNKETGKRDMGYEIISVKP